MKSTRSRAKRATGINLCGAVFTLSNAKAYLGRLVDKSGRGDVVHIVRRHRQFILQEAREIDPMPIRPPGYFNNLGTREEIRELNELAKASLIRPPTDLR